MGLRDGTAAASGMFRLLNRSNERLLSVNIADTDVLTKSSSATAPQDWVFTPQNGSWMIHDLRSATTRMCLDVRQQPAGTVVRQWGCEAANGDQHWRLALQ